MLLVRNRQISKGCPGVALRASQGTAIISLTLRLRRAIIIFVLYKEGKADYLLLGSYRPIALENTLSKILERVIADYIVDMAK